MTEYACPSEIELNQMIERAKKDEEYALLFGAYDDLIDGFKEWEREIDKLAGKNLI